MDPSIFKKTKDTLGKVISKPPMTEKLLSRPPFRYLHDVISAVVRTSGFYNGLYSAQEMDVKTIQDKEAKVSYLQKAIDALSFTLGEVVRVRPSKIIAGQDPERTNEFLQLLGTAILNKMDSTEGVRRVLNGEKPSDTKKKPSEKTSEAAEASKERPKTVKSSRKTKEGGAEAGPGEEPEADSTKPSKSKRGAEGTGSPKASKAKVKGGKAKDGGEGSKPKKEPGSKAKGGADAKTEEEPSKPKKQREKDKEKGKEKDEDAGASKEGKKKKEHKVSREELKDELQGEESGLMARPVHKPRKKKISREADLPQKPSEDRGGLSDSPDVDNEKNQDLDRPHSAKGSRKRKKKPKVDSPLASPTPAAEEPGDSKLLESDAAGLMAGDLPSTVIMDTPGGEEDDEAAMDDDNMFIVEDSTPLVPPNKAFEGDRNMSDKPEGALTKTIVAMKERLEGDMDKDTPQSTMPAISEAQRRKEREIVTKEIEKLQNTIQVLCKSANPLGKIMDYVQEDMDSMQKELEMWQTENTKHMQSLHNEQLTTQQELQPLRTTLQELDAKIREQEEMIGAVKANILKNDVKTQQMLNTLTFGSH